MISSNHSGTSASSTKKFPISKDIVTECEQGVGDLMTRWAVSREKNKVQVQSFKNPVSLGPLGKRK